MTEPRNSSTQTEAYRIGQGLDVHPFVADRPLVLGGVTIPHEKGLDGHSDADALAHAVIDALLGAAALGDIGSHFPSSDERWRGISSLELARQTRALLAAQGAHVVNVDATVVAQRPKLAPHVAQMRANLAAALGVAADRVSVKATTTDGLGFAGRQEGIAASAVALIRKEAT